MSSIPVTPHKLILKEDNKPLPGRYTRTRFVATEGVSTDISNIHVPPLRNAYLNCRDAFLTFSVTASVEGTNLPTATTLPNNLKLDPSGACSFIRSVTILQNNSTIQHIDNYSKVHSMVQVSEASLDSSGIRSLLTGSANYSSADGSTAVASRGGLTLDGTPVTNWGKVVGTDGTEVTTPQMTFCLPIIGLLSSANIPLCMLKEGLTIRINWSPDVRNSFYCVQTQAAGDQPTITGIGSMTFENVSFDSGVATLDDASQLAVEAENNYRTEPIQWSGNDYYAGIRNTTAAELTTATTAEHILGGFTFTSTKSILYGTFCKPVGDINAPNVPHIVHNKIRYRANGVERPRNPIDTLAKMVQHTAITTGGNSQSVATGLMTRQYTDINFRPLTGVALATDELFTDRGVCGVNFSSFPAQDAISGVDTRGGDISVQLSTSGVASAVNMDTFFVGIFDCVYMLEDGVLKLSF